MPSSCMSDRIYRILRINKGGTVAAATPQRVDSRCGSAAWWLRLRRAFVLEISRRLDRYFELSLICCALLLADSSGALPFFRMSIAFCAEAMASFLFPSLA